MCCGMGKASQAGESRPNPRLVPWLLGELQTDEHLPLRPCPADRRGPLPLGQGVRLRAGGHENTGPVSSRRTITCRLSKPTTRPAPAHPLRSPNSPSHLTVSVSHPWKANFPPAAPSGPSSGNSVSTAGSRSRMGTRPYAMRRLLVRADDQKTLMKMSGAPVLADIRGGERGVRGLAVSPPNSPRRGHAHKPTHAHTPRTQRGGVCAPGVLPVERVRDEHVRRLELLPEEHEHVPARVLQALGFIPRGRLGARQHVGHLGRGRKGGGAASFQWRL